MEHFVRIVTENIGHDAIDRLDETAFPNHELYETEQGAVVFHIPLPRALTEEEADEYAERLSVYMLEEGYTDFDIEVSTDDDTEIDEETYEDDDFYEEYGVMWFNEDDELDEAKYRGRKVRLGKPMRGDVKKFKVYVRKPNGNVVKVNFGSKKMRIKKSNPARRRSFRARHNCDNPGPRWKARYWSCRKW